ELYREYILDLYKNPLNKGTLENPTHEYKKNNPLCGDEITIQLIVENGKIILKGQDITGAKVHERAKQGLFLSFQYPYEVSGVSMFNFLRLALNEKLNVKKLSPFEFRKLLNEKLDMLKMPQNFADRYLNEGFSGGEKKKAEILQLAVLQPEIAILDETDSGLDIDALKIVAEGINKLRSKELGILLITHYQRILGYIKPDKVYVMIGGRIVKSGSKELAQELEEKGYETLELK
ncbi:MAG: Fe-S cluster assembly ATPase SufC, partial [Nanoarchaeota archaeon]